MLDAVCPSRKGSEQARSSAEQRAFSLGYHCSPGRPDIADWPKEYVEKQITTAEQMERLTLLDGNLIAQKRRGWTMQWQDIMGS